MWQFIIIAFVAEILVKESVADVLPSCVPPPICTKENEEYSICPPKCPYRTCGIDDNVIDCMPQPVPGDKDCPPPKCICKPQYFRDDKGNCVPWEKCPTCPGCNEVYDPCDAPCPERTCAFDPTLVLCKKPPQLGDKECVVGCRCQDGFLRNSTGVCVPRDQCYPRCNKNEVWDPCPDSNPQTCSTYDKKLPCPIPCKGACRCKKGYVRDNNGDCVPVEYCSKCTNPNEVYDPCPDCSPQTCETRNNTYSCPAILADPCDPSCKPACRCRRGYFRNKIGECISAEDCGKCSEEHEYWSCGPACDNRCDSIYGQDNCNIINIVCNQMCYCEKGYARATNGTCIPKEDCQYECPKNEEYNECPDALCVAETCSEAGFPLECSSLPIEEPCPGTPGCICIDGFLRDYNGVCVPSANCPSCGGDKNATLGCGNHCGNTCSDYNIPNTACPLYCNINGCQCRKGYVYDSNTKQCVLPCDCTPVCKENEVYSKCVNDCKNRYCSDLGNSDTICVEPTICKEGCVCAEGYLRNKDGKCVPIDQCDHCPPNEDYNKCPEAVCVPKKCSDIGFPLNCTVINDGDPCPGRPGCICKSGHLRDCNGVCIPSENCPSCGGDKNATLGCGNHCGNTCSDYLDTTKACPPSCILNGCDCRKGYVYDTNTKKCVLPCDCIKCPINEVYDPCDAPCPQRTCAFDPTVVKCSAPPKPGDIACVVGCRCQDGYLRNAKGVCVPKAECPPKCKINEVWDPCPDCNPQTCATIGKILPCPLKPCQGACRCKKGFVRDDKGNCVAIDYCYKCPPNEEYNKCPAALCVAKKCSDLGFPLNCTSVKDGAPCPGGPGCICKTGYLRNSNGVCIPIDNCPSCGGDKNATLGCGNHCGNTCSDYLDTTKACPASCILNGCNCRKGYVYDTNTKKCVLPCDCTPKCKANEVWNPCPDCNPQTCSTIDIALPCLPTPCKGACRCKKGYVRDNKGNCVPIDYCHKCPDNEVYNKCPAALCIAKKCSDVGFPLNCTTVKEGDPCPGKPGCICKSGYLRDCNSVCVPSKDCPSCGGDKNATRGCGSNCGKRCSTYNNGPGICPISCVLNGCECRDGYVYDDNTKECVLPCDCTPPCKKNEVFSKCANGGCDKKYCKDLNKPNACVHPKICKGGCVCAKGYLRDSCGCCIPISKCPKS